MLLTRRKATLVAASLGFGMIQLDVTVVNVAVKPIGAAFHTGVAELQWTISAYTLMLAALILTAGALGDRFGAKRVFSAGFITFVLASSACGLAPSPLVLIVARALQGVGAALLGSCSLALLSHTFHEPRDRARALGWWAAGASSALSAGPVIGGVLIALLGWRSIFFINVPIGLFGLWLTDRYARETPQSAGRKLDVAGSVTATLALCGLAAALIEAGAGSASTSAALAGAAVFALAAPAFLAIEARRRDPMLPLSLFRSRQFTGPATVGLLVNVCFYGLIFLFSLLFQVDHRLSPLQTGLLFLPMTLAILAGNLASGKLTSTRGATGAMLIGVLVMIVGCAGLIWSSHATGYPLILAEQILLGAGLGLLVPPMTGALMSSAPRSRSGMASGALTTMRQTGSMLGVALFGSLIAGRAGFYAGLHTAVLVSIGVLIASACLARATAARNPGGREPAYAASQPEV